LKIGRNEPCPCGSGKKYKKCCAMKEVEPDPSQTEEMETGTFFDEYLRLLEGISLYYQLLLKSDKDRNELRKIIKESEKQFRPGKEDGVNDSLYMPWLFFDLRFGKSGKTVCERFLTSDLIKALRDPGPTLIRSMSESYSTFYELAGLSESEIRFRELGTDKEWNVHRVNEPEGAEVLRGDIWYVRFVGPPEDAYIFSAPYIFPPDAKKDFTKAVGMQVKETEKSLGDGVGADVLFRESCKEVLPGWAEYMMDSQEDMFDEDFDDDLFDEFDEETEEPAAMPILLNTDGEALRLCKIIFKIVDAKGVKERLTSMVGIDYDEHNKTWIWFKKGNKAMSVLPTTSLGTLTIKRGRLVGETNSEERAEKLIRKIKKSLGGLASFEKMEVKDIGEMLHPSKKERKD
jgi:hypothetical protein